MASLKSSELVTETYHPPRPDAEKRFYSVTVGRDIGIFLGTYNWTSLIEGIPGSAVRSFDTEEDAKKSFHESLMNGLVERVQILGERRTLTEDEVSGIPGLVAGPVVDIPEGQKWFCVTVGTDPGLYPASQSINPLITNVRGNCSQKWGTYNEARNSFMMFLRDHKVVKDTTRIIRTKVPVTFTLDNIL